MSGRPPAALALHDALAEPRRIVIAALVACALLGWAYLLVWPMPMPAHGGVAAPAYLAASTLMWLLMMVAMMVPSVAPAVLLFDRVIRHHAPQDLRLPLCFLAGYLSVWAAFSVMATIVQLALILSGLIDTMGVAQSPWFATLLLAGAGVYQLSPLKAACLSRCRSPAEAIAGRFRPGAGGAWRMGAAHGLDCLGCCWAMMLLLFVGGVMSLAWVIGLSVLVAIEKLAPAWPSLPRWLGGALITSAAWILARSIASAA